MEPESDQLSLHLDIFISIHQIPLTNSPVYVLLYSALDKATQFRTISSTQDLPPSSTLNFVKPIRIDYFFQRPHKIKVVLFSREDRKAIATVITSVSKLMGSANQRLKLPVENSKGNFEISWQKVQDESLQVILRMRPEGFQPKQKGILSCIISPEIKNPNLKLSKQHGKAENIIYEKETYRSEEIKMPLIRFSDGNRDLPIVFQCSKGKEILGRATESVSSLHTKMGKKQPIRMIRDNQESGYLHLLRFELQERPNFVTILKGGLNISTSVAIDFTESNKDFEFPDSLHYHTREKPSKYFVALKEVLSVVLDYDHRKEVLAMGFGAKINQVPDKVSHCFPLTLQQEKWTCTGLDELLSCYTTIFEGIHFSGPTHFAPILKQCRQKSLKTKNDPYNYQIIVILTDGCIHDIEQTVDEIFLMAKMPISIIIIGIGKADFSKMELLDGDDGLYNKKNELCERDLVQFVVFEDVNNDPDVLRSQVLEELPRQVEEYFMLNGIKLRK